MVKLCICNSVLVTFQGLNDIGLNGMITSEPVLSEILRPPSLKNKVLKVDPATALCTVAVDNLIQPIQGSKKNVGIVLGTRLGNYQIIKEYVSKTNSKKKAPTLYSASGYNICVGVPALVHELQGPTFVMAGSNALSDMFLIAGNILKRQDVKALLVGKVDVNPNGKSGICVMYTVTSQCNKNSIIEIQEANESLKSIEISNEERDSNNFMGFIKDYHEEMVSSYLLWEKYNAGKGFVLSENNTSCFNSIKYIN